MPGSRDDGRDRTNGQRRTGLTDGGRGPGQGGGGHGGGDGHGGGGGHSGGGYGGGTGGVGGGGAGAGGAGAGGGGGNSPTGGSRGGAGGRGGGQYSGGGQYAGGGQMGHAPRTASGGSFLTGPVTTAYVKFCAAVYAAIGVGIGLLLFVLDAVGMSPVIVEWTEYSTVEGGTVERSEAIPLISGEFLYPLLVILAVAVSVAVAVYVSRNRDLTDTDAASAAAAGTGVGSLTLLVTGGFLGFQKLRFVELLTSLTDDPSAEQEISNAYTIEPVNLVVNAVVVAVFAAAIAVAVVYSLRNLAPDR